MSENCDHEWLLYLGVKVVCKKCGIEQYHNIQDHIDEPSWDSNCNNASSVDNSSDVG